MARQVAEGTSTADFLDWALPRLSLRPRAFVNMGGTLRKRLRWRMREVGAGDLDAYRARLESEPEEWRVLDRICRIPISRFYRDAAVYERLAEAILPGRAEAAEREGRRSVDVWSAGCASGEEPYTVSLLWHLDVARASRGVALEVLATDVDDVMLARAQRRTYVESSLRELPLRLRLAAFEPVGGAFRMKEVFTRGVTFRREDLREAQPPGPFDVVVCRNSAFTYFDETLQRDAGERLAERLRPGGVLVVAPHERVAEGRALLDALGGGVYVRR